VVPKLSGDQLYGLALGKECGKGDAAFEACERRPSAIVVAGPRAR
jgi:hypothetical protein